MNVSDKDEIQESPQTTAEQIADEGQEDPGPGPSAETQNKYVAYSLKPRRRLVFG